MGLNNESFPSNDSDLSSSEREFLDSLDKSSSSDTEDYETVV